jgi:hypothetical protein
LADWRSRNPTTWGLSVEKMKVVLGGLSIRQFDDVLSDLISSGEIKLMESLYVLLISPIFLLWLLLF